MAALAQEAIFPKAAWQGTQGFVPFPCRDHLLGSGGCHPNNQYPGRAPGAGKGSRGARQSLTSPLISSSTFQTECFNACFEKVNPVSLKLVQSSLQLTCVLSSIDTHFTDKQFWNITVASLHISLLIPCPHPSSPLVHTEAFGFCVFTYAAKCEGKKKTLKILIIFYFS